MTHRNLVSRMGIARSWRLALSYLAIIMALSICFSIIFYETSTGDLANHVQLPTNSNRDPGNMQKQAPMIAGVTTNGKPTVVSSTSLADLNTQLQRQVATIRTDLAHRLIELNAAALVVGAILSFYLARRTLRPIEIALEAQSRFAADASHELRTPLTVMQTEIDVVLNKPNLSVKRAKLALKNNRQELTNLTQLAESLLQLARTSEKLESFRHLQLDEVASEAVNHVMKLAQAKDITITDAVPNIAVHGERQSIVRVFVILLDNAIKYSPRKRTIYIDAKAEGKHVCLSIRDEGSGISAADQTHIFERFYRAPSSRTHKYPKGYGLGLAIAQEVIRQHNGTLTVASTVGQGSTFTIKIPK